MPNMNIGGEALGDIILAGPQNSVYNRTVTSTLTLTQFIATLHESVTSPLSFNQTISYHQTFAKSVTSTLTFSQSIVNVKSFTVNNTLSLSQTIVQAKTKPREIDESLAFSQTIVGNRIGARLIVSGLSFAHTRNYNAVFNRSLSDSLTLSQTIHADKCTTASNTLSLTQTITYTKGKLVKHSLEWQQSFVYPTSFVRPINTILGVSQQIAKTGQFNKTVSQSLSLSQTIVQARVKGVSQTLSFSQSIVAYAARNVKNTLTFGQSIAVQMVYNRTTEQVLGLEESILLNRSLSKEIHHGFGMNSFVGKYRVNTRSLTDNLTLSQQVRFNVYNKTVSQTLSLSDAVSHTHVVPLSVVSSLQFNETVGLNRVITESVTSTLAFLPARQVYIGMGDVDYYNVDNLQYSLVPAYLVGKKNRPMCILQVRNGAITLPAPEFGDTENYGGVFTIRRSMNNIPYTHVRTLSLRKLHLPFVLAKRKAWELREFLIQHNPEVMTLTTWKGDKWFVNLTTNPLELRVSGRYDLEDEKVSVELEFEGLKVM
jgi:hypothetical protein